MHRERVRAWRRGARQGKGQLGDAVADRANGSGNAAREPQDTQGDGAGKAVVGCNVNRGGCAGAGVCRQGTGSAESPNEGTPGVALKSLIKGWPAGVPQPVARSYPERAAKPLLPVGYIMEIARVIGSEGQWNKEWD